jgi:hypothetical protein
MFATAACRTAMKIRDSLLRGRKPLPKKREKRKKEKRKKKA